MKYITVSVYRNSNGYDCTANGYTSRDDVTLAVPVERGNLSEEDCFEAGYIMLESMPEAFPGCGPRFRKRGEEAWTMFGGNFVYTSDSRFSETYGRAPVAVHDRIEG